MKTAEELNALKAEVEALNGKLAELTDEELAQVIGGAAQQDWSEGDRILVHYSGSEQPLYQAVVKSATSDPDLKPFLDPDPQSPSVVYQPTSERT